MPSPTPSIPSIHMAVLLLAALLATAPAAGADMPASESESQPVEEANEDDRSYAKSALQAFDACVLRPLGAGQVVAGFGFFVAGLPLTALSQRIPESWDVLVMGPVAYTFQRPLGRP